MLREERRRRGEGEKHGECFELVSFHAHKETAFLEQLRKVRLLLVLAP